MKKSRPVLAISCLAIIINSLFSWLPVFAGLSNGWSIILATTISAAIGAYIYPNGEEAA